MLVHHEVMPFLTLVEMESLHEASCFPKTTLGYVVRTQHPVPTMHQFYTQSTLT